MMQTNITFLIVAFITWPLLRETQQSSFGVTIGLNSKDLQRDVTLLLQINVSFSLRLLYGFFLIHNFKPLQPCNIRRT